MAPTTLALLERAGVGPGLHCLDVGCGGGDVSRDVARLVGPSGSVVGIDVDPTKVDLARAESGEVAKLEFRVADITGGLGDSAYDVVYARFVLTHLRDPAAAVAHMYDALRPAGRLIVEDVDFRGSFCEPEVAAFERYEEVYSETARRNGGDPDIGLRIPRMLVAAGFAHVRTDVAQPAGLEGDVKLLPALTLENIKAMAIQHVVSTEGEGRPPRHRALRRGARPRDVRRQPADRPGLGRPPLSPTRGPRRPRATPPRAPHAPRRRRRAPSRWP